DQLIHDPLALRTCGGIAIILNAVFGDDKRDASLFVPRVMIWQLSQQQQSSENESLPTKYRAGVSAMHYCARRDCHHLRNETIAVTDTDLDRPNTCWYFSDPVNQNLITPISPCILK